MAKNLNISGLAAAQAGLKELSDQVQSSKSYTVGSPVHYGAMLETGTRHMPPYPWLGPSVESVTSRGGSLLSASENPDEFVKMVALEIQREATTRLESTSTRPYRQTGNLAGSVDVVPGDE